MAHLKILITGGAGFVGSAIVRAALGGFDNATVGVLDLDLTKVPEPVQSSPRVELIRADITIPESIGKAIASFRPAIVIHTAGIVPILAERHKRRMQAVVYKVNVEGTENVVKATMENGVPSLVYTSSCCAVIDDVRRSYRNIDETWPTSKKSSIYGESKVRQRSISTSASNHSRLLRRKLSSTPIASHSPHVFFVHPSCAVRAIFLSCRLFMPVSQSMKPHLSLAMGATFGMSPTLRTLPMPTYLLRGIFCPPRQQQGRHFLSRITNRSHFET